MTRKSDNPTRISRRKIIPILGTSLLIPFIGLGNTEGPVEEPSKDEEYTTLLKPDGSIVKIRKSSLEKSKVVKKKISNSGLLNWLGKKL